MFTKKKFGIKETLKGYMDGISIDVFGYEEKVNENVLKYINELEYREQIVRSGINVRIGMESNALSVKLYCFSNLIRSIEISELIRFFYGEGMSELLNLKPKVNSKVTAYLEMLSATRHVPIGQINVRISSPEDKVVSVSMYDDHTFHSHLKIKELIKYFK